MPYSGKSKRRFYRKSRKTYIPRSVKAYVAKTLDKSLEDKQIVRNLTDYSSLPNTWTEINLCAPSQGVADGQRIARRIKIKSLHVKGVITGGITGTTLDDSYNVVRMVVATFTYPAGTTPLATYGATIHQPLMKTVNLAALKHLYADKYITLNASTNEKGPGDGYAPIAKNVSYYKKFKNLYVNFADDTATTPHVRLFLSFISDSSAVAHPGFVAGYILVKYEDA